MPKSPPDHSPTTSYIMRNLHWRMPQEILTQWWFLQDMEDDLEADAAGNLDALGPLIDLLRPRNVRRTLWPLPKKPSPKPSIYSSQALDATYTPTIRSFGSELDFESVSEECGIIREEQVEFLEVRELVLGSGGEGKEDYVRRWVEDGWKWAGCPAVISEEKMDVGVCGRMNGTEVGGLGGMGGKWTVEELFAVFETSLGVGGGKRDRGSGESSDREERGKKRKLIDIDGLFDVFEDVKPGGDWVKRGVGEGGRKYKRMRRTGGPK